MSANFAPLSRPESQVRLDQTQNLPQSDGFNVSSFSLPRTIANTGLQVAYFSSFEQASARNLVSGILGAFKRAEGTDHRKRERRLIRSHYFQRYQIMACGWLF
jgi:hypothetical protein